MVNRVVSSKSRLLVLRTKCAARCIQGGGWQRGSGGQSSNAAHSLMPSRFWMARVLARVSAVAGTSAGERSQSNVVVSGASDSDSWRHIALLKHVFAALKWAHTSVGLHEALLACTHNANGSVRPFLVAAAAARTSVAGAVGVGVAAVAHGGAHDEVGAHHVAVCVAHLVLAADLCAARRDARSAPARVQPERRTSHTRADVEVERQAAPPVLLDEALCHKHVRQRRLLRA